MRSGCVRWFSLRKGYGFIIPDDGRDDVFVHISELEKAGIAFLINSVLTGEELWHQISEYGRNHDIFDTDQIKGSF